MSKLIGQIKRAASFHLTRSSSSRGSADIQIDVTSPTVGALSRSSFAKRNILLEEKHLKLWDKTEKDIYKQLKNQGFILTPTFDLALLQSTGMNTEFEIIFKTIGWENA